MESSSHRQRIIPWWKKFSSARSDERLQTHEAAVPRHLVVTEQPGESTSSIVTWQLYKVEKSLSVLTRPPSFLLARNDPRVRRSLSPSYPVLSVPVPLLSPLLRSPSDFFSKATQTQPVPRVHRGTLSKAEVANKEMQNDFASKKRSFTPPGTPLSYTPPGSPPGLYHLDLIRKRDRSSSIRLNLPSLIDRD